MSGTHKSMPALSLVMLVLVFLELTEWYLQSIIVELNLCNIVSHNFKENICQETGGTRFLRFLLLNICYVH